MIRHARGILHIDINIDIVLYHKTFQNSIGFSTFLHNIYNIRKEYADKNKKIPAREKKIRAQPVIVSAFRIP